MFRRERSGTFAATAAIGASAVVVAATGIAVVLLGASRSHAKAAAVVAVPAAPAVTTPRPIGYAHQASTRHARAAYATLRLQQLLARLGYLPVSWRSGAFTWHSGYPGTLGGFWHPGRPNLITTGAIMAFESQHGMRPRGTASPAVWKVLLRAAGQRQMNTAGYTYAIASQMTPETLTIWHNGREVFRSYANTGIPVAPTANGTFPVYLRYYFQVMRGTNPDGSRYADPVYYISYFHAGEAVHYFFRSGYGWPQSLGCVELPWSSAAKAWPYLTYGSLVTVKPA
ncbi:MAG TPA: L,D-transpeptidase [Streptosporangiaceae bacterium]